MKYAFYPGCTFSSAAGYKESFNAVNEALGITMEEIPDWNCCGATVSFSVDQDDALLVGARNLALAEKKGFHQLITGCNACYTTLRKVQTILKEDPDLLAKVNHRLDNEGLRANPETAVRHHLEILVNDVARDKWKTVDSTDVSHIRVAGYYGCQLTRPWNDIEPSNILEVLIERAGFTAVDHSAQTLCCGAALAVPYAEDTAPLIGRITRAMTMGRADMMTTICPLCQLNMDQGQDELPVTYYTQIAGLGLGIDPDRLGMKKLLNPVTMN